MLNLSEDLDRDKSLARLGHMILTSIFIFDYYKMASRNLAHEIKPRQIIYSGIIYSHKQGDIIYMYISSICITLKDTL